jgi:hypothetical protein
MPGRTAPGGWCAADAVVVGASRLPSSVLLECLFGAGNQARIVACGDHSGENVDGPGVPGLQAELVHGHASDAGARIALDPLDQEFHDIEGERPDLAPLAADGVDGMPADERGSVAQGRAQWRAATLVSQVIHERYAGRPNPWAAVDRPDHERRHRLLALVEQLPERPFANRPLVGIKVA